MTDARTNPNPFALYLRELITEDRRTVARIVRESGCIVALSTMHAYKGGWRLPVDGTALQKVIDTLGLGTEKAAKLRRKYVVALDEQTKLRAAVTPTEAGA